MNLISFNFNYNLLLNTIVNGRFELSLYFFKYTNYYESENLYFKNYLITP